VVALGGIEDALFWITRRTQSSPLFFFPREVV
jgi:hypothetical protein